jgi:hypothetical protein
LISWRGGANKLSKSDPQREASARGSGEASKGREVAIGTEQEERDVDFSLKVDYGDCRLVRLNRGMPLAEQCFKGGNRWRFASLLT